MKRHQTSVREKQRVKVSALIGLMTVLIVLAIERMLPSPSLSAAAKESDITMNGIGSLESLTTTDGQPLRRITVDWPINPERDPFAWDTRFPAPETPIRPMTVPTKAHEFVEINLEGIVYGESPWAIINGTIARVNDVIGDVRIVRIERRFIVVERNDIQWRLDL